MVFPSPLVAAKSGLRLACWQPAVIAISAGWPTVVTAISIVLSTAVTMGVGLASGYYPASRAASPDPIAVLRHE